MHAIEITMRLRLRHAALLVAATLTPVALAAPAAHPTASPSAQPLRPKVALERVALANGLRVVLDPDASSPSIAVVVWYDVGSRNERPGEGGFAHLFEHLMFEGTTKLPRGVFDTVVEGRGGNDNAATSEDWTRYFEMMPSSELAATLYLEADRMRSLDVTEEAFENQRKVVQEEYRMRVDNAPYVKGYFKLMELAYEGYHPYAHPAIGSMAELDAAKLAWVRAFHASYYGPNNAVLVVSGDVRRDEALQLVHRYFDDIPRVKVKPFAAGDFAGRATPRSPVPPPVPVVEDPFARTPATMLAWVIPRDGERDHYALEVASAVLAGGESTRLQRKLVRELGWATEVSVSTEDHRGPDAFVVDARLSEKGRVEDVEKLIRAELASLAKTAPAADEMKKARAKLEHALLFGLQSNLSRALTLAKLEGERGDARLLATEIDRYLEISSEDVRRAVATYLVPDKSAHVRVMPKAGATLASVPAASASSGPPNAPSSTIGGAR